MDALKAEIGLGGVSKILDDLGRGVDFETAYANVSGRALAAFLRSLPDALAKAAPAKVVTTELPSGEVRWTLKGGLPGAKANVTVDGREGTQYHLQFDVATDENGGYTSTFGSTAPAGSYFVQVVAGDAEVSATARVRKP